MGLSPDSANKYLYLFQSENSCLQPAKAEAGKLLKLVPGKGRGKD
jgi:hypothetical protein